MTVTESSATTRQTPPPWRRLRRTGWWVMAVLCPATLALVSKYFGLNPANFFEQQRDVYLRHETMLALHICGASLALAVGPLHSVYTAAAWLCWVPNLLFALWITRARPAPSIPQRRNLS